MYPNHPNLPPGAWPMPGPHLAAPMAGPHGSATNAPPWGFAAMGPQPQSHPQQDAHGAAAAAAAAAASAAAGAAFTAMPGYAPGMPVPGVAGGPFMQGQAGGVALPWAAGPGDSQAGPSAVKVTETEKYETVLDQCALCVTDRDVCYVFFKCGHFPFCQGCMSMYSGNTPGILKCPVCRKQASEVRVVRKVKKIESL